MSKKQKVTLALRYVAALAITLVALIVFLKTSKAEQEADAAAATEIIMETERYTE